MNGNMTGMNAIDPSLVIDHAKVAAMEQMMNMNAAGSKRDYYIRVVYNNDVLPLQFCKPNKDGFCKWSDYKKYMAENAYTTFEKY